jgi:hypothetical protein
MHWIGESLQTSKVSILKLPFNHSSHTSHLEMTTLKNILLTLLKLFVVIRRFQVPR